MESLQHLGFDDWFQDHLEADKLALHEIARVVSVHKDSYMITKGHGDVFAELTGKLAFTADSAADLPTTGDWVYVIFMTMTLMPLSTIFILAKQSFKESLLEKHLTYN